MSEAESAFHVKHALGPLPLDVIAALRREDPCFLTGLPQRMADKIEFSALCGCWTWKASKSGNGYGRVRIAGKLRNAHQVTFELKIGPVPASLVLHHLCYNRACVNPFHLALDTQEVNVKDGGAVLYRMLKEEGIAA